MYSLLGDKYDEEPSSVGGGRSNHNLDEIDDWDSGNKSIASEAVDKVKGLWNKVQGRRGPDDIVDYRWGIQVNIMIYAYNNMLLKCNIWATQRKSFSFLNENRFREIGQC